MKKEQKKEKELMNECKRCLLYEMADRDLYTRIRRTIEAIPASMRCEEEAYQARLASCKTCEKLISGMCRVCGCYVEVRAAKREEHCPLPGEKLW
ncbi:MAG: hypothetical protein IJ468_10590 [Lachnospiraceae bacterium]|nr:hypothetical protein [Lachnospiraceae bacterium]